MFSRITHLILILTLSVLLNSCGNVSSEGGIGGTGISAGSISSFGSVYVNGVKYETTTATFSGDDNEAGNQSGLRVGMVVTVKGTINNDGTTGTADNIKFEDLIEGPISAKDTNTLTIMGHTINVDANTQYEGTTFASLVPTNVVEVSGFYDANYDITATYIEITSSSSHEVTGKVTSFTDGQFVINNGKLTVNSPATVANDNYVEVKGTYSGTALNASSVEFKTEGFDVSDKDKAELEGIATSACVLVTSSCTFIVNGVTVSVDNTTQFESGIAADIIVGTHLEVEGVLTAGILIAEEIKFKNKVEADVRIDTASADVGGTRTLTLTDTNSVLTALTIVVNSDPSVTEFNTNTITYGSIAEGQYLKFRGIMNGSVLIAKRVEDGDNSKTIIKGAVDAFNATTPSVTVMGVTITTSTLTHLLDDGSAGGKTITTTAFYDLLGKNNATVKVKGKLDASSAVKWTEIKIDL